MEKAKNRLVLLFENDPDYDLIELLSKELQEHKDDELSGKSSGRSRQD